MTGGIMHTPSHTNVCKLFNFQLTFSQLILEVETMINNCNNDEQLSAEIKEYDNLKTELQQIYEAKGKGAILRSKARWVEQGEKSTKYFFNLEKRNFNRKVITEIRREDGKTLLEEHEILKEIESFYGKLYAS